MAMCHEQRSAGYAGKKQEVKVHHDEGVANHIDPSHAQLPARVSAKR